MTMAVWLWQFNKIMIQDMQWLMSLRGLLPKLLNITVNSFVYLITNSHFCVKNLFASFNSFTGRSLFFAPKNLNGLLKLAIIRKRANKVREMPEAFAPYWCTTLSSKLRCKIDYNLSLRYCLIFFYTFQTFHICRLTVSELFTQRPFIDPV